MCLYLLRLLEGFLVDALLKKAEEAAAVARAGVAVMVSTRGGGEFIFHFSMS